MTLPHYNVCAIDIGSPKLGNIGWCFIDTQGHEVTGEHLDDLIPHIAQHAPSAPTLLGLEAPLFVPIREDLMEATKGRRGEGRRPWSAGAGAQVLAINLPIMVYLFGRIKDAVGDVSFALNEAEFTRKAQEILLFEALVSGQNKGATHVEDAQIMVHGCLTYAETGALPESILEKACDDDFFNLAAAALLKCGLRTDLESLSMPCPIYTPCDTPY